MPVDTMLSVASGVIAGYFGLSVIVFGVRPLVEFVVKPFAAELPFTKALTWVLGTCLMVMVFYEVGSVWITILSPGDLARQQALMKAWIASNFAGFLVYALVPSIEKKLRRK